MKFTVSALALVALILVAPVHAVSPPVFETSWGSQGSGAGEFDSPAGIALDGSGHVYVADFGGARIQKFSAAGDYELSWGRMGSGPGEFDLPQGLTAGPGNTLYVADVFNHRIQVFSTDSTLVNFWGSIGSADGEFSNPRDVALAQDGSIYVADANNDRIQRFTAQGVFLAKWGAFGTKSGEFSSPQHLAVGPEGNVYVSDAFNHRVQKFDSTGAFLFAFGENGPDEGQFVNPRDLAVDSGGSIYVPDVGNNRLQIFGPNGTLLSVLGGKPSGSGEGQFIYPEAVAVDGRGNVYVVDSGNNRIQKFTPRPLLVAITDVANDQGGQVRIQITSSSQDASPAVVPIIQYEVFRRIDSTISAAGGNGLRPQADRVAGMLSDQSVLLNGWDFVGAVPAHAEEEYSTLVATLVDSTAEQGPSHSFFFVRAATANPAVFFDSEVDSGYSIDNLEPNVPGDFSIEGVSTNGDVTLKWSPSAAPDLRYYSVYRGLERDFEPTEVNLVTRTTAAGCVDEAAAAGGLLYFYKLSATDFSGNESGFALASTGVVAVEAAGGVPTVFALRAAAPNPLRNSTTVGFDLPVSTPVTLRFHDARGRVVRRALDNAVLPAGRQQWIWDARDDSGRRVPPGMYFYTLTSPRFSGTGKTVVVE